MKTRSAFPVMHAVIACLVSGLFPWFAHAAGQPALFTEAKITEVVKDVNVVNPTDPSAPTPAKVNDQFRAPDLLQTGARSRAQLTASDGTIARVGSNTVFSFQADSRTIKLQQGSILFNSPKGGGGGTVVTNSATATVLGTTIIVAATSDGGFKVLVLEGHAQVTFPNGQTVTLNPGQMTFVLPATQSGSTGGTRGGSSGGTSSGNGSTPAGTPGPVLNFDLSRQSENSDLVNGFTMVLPSQPLVIQATQEQQGKINSGQLVQTNQAVIGAVGTNQVVLVDSSTISNALNSNPANQPQSPASPVTPPSQLQQALASSISLTPGAPLPSQNIFLTPQIFSAASLGIPNGLIRNNQASIIGLIAGDISANGIINLNQLDSLLEIDLFAANTHTFTFGPNTVFGNLTQTFGINIESEGSFVIPTGASISTDFPVGDDVQLDIGSINDMNLQQVQISNPSGDVTVETIVGNLTMNGTSVTGSSIGGGQEDSVSVLSYLGDINISGNSVLTAGENEFGEGVINVQSTGNVTVQDSTLRLGTTNGNFTFFFGDINMRSNKNVSVINNQIESSNLNIMGGPLATVSGGNIDMVTTTTIAAATVNLSNIDFNGTSAVYLWSATGNLASSPNSGASSSSGNINFLTGVLYGGQPAENFVTPENGGAGPIYLGITADNTAVQAALGQTLTLSGNTTIPPSLLINSDVMFTPADIAAISANYTGSEIEFSAGGIIAGNIVVNGDASFASTGSTVNIMTGNLQVATSSTLTIGGNVTDLDIQALGAASIAPNTTLTTDFTNVSPGDLSFFDVLSLSSLSLTNVTINNPTGTVQLESQSQNDPAISLNGVALNAGAGVSLFSYNGGSISVDTSILTGNTAQSSLGGGVDIGSENDYGNISIKSSTLRGDNVSVSNFSDTGGNISIQASLFDSDTTHVHGGNVVIGSSILSGNNSVIISGQGGDAEGVVTINSGTLASNNDGFISITADKAIGIQSSNLTASSTDPNAEASISLGGTFDFNGTLTPDINIQSSNLNASGADVVSISGGNIIIAGTTISGNLGVTINPAVSVSVQNSMINAANGSILIEATGNAAISNTPLLAPNVTIGGGALVSLSNGNLGLATRVNIGGDTVNLSSVNFPGNSSVFLWTTTGSLASNPNTGAASQIGFINFLTGVQYGGSPAQNFLGNGIYLSSAQNPRQVVEAIASGIDISGDQPIPAVNIFTQPTAFPAAYLGIPNGVIANNSHSFTGVLASGITVGDDVDFTELDGLRRVDVVATNAGGLVYNGDTTFSGLSVASQLSIGTVGALSISGTTITTNFSNSGDNYENGPISTEIFSADDLNLQQANISNPGGDMNFSSVLGNVTFDGTQASAALNSQYNNPDFGSTLEIDTNFGGSININGSSTLTADYNGEIAMFAAGNVTVQDSTLQFGASPATNPNFGDIQLQANGNMLISNSTLLGQNVNLMGGPKVTVSGGNISYPSNVQIAAATLDLSNLNFNGTSSVTLWSANGVLAPNANNGNASVAGDVNFLAGVLYGGSPAQNFINNGINLGITADNAGVQSALTQSLTLPATANTIPGNLLFGQVMFTSADIAAYAPNYTNDAILFAGGLIVGNLTQSGNFTGAGGPALVNNFNLASSATTNVISGNTETLYVLGTFSVAHGTSFTFNFTGLSAGDTSNYTLISIPAFSVSNSNITNPTGDINFETLNDNSSAAIGMNLTSVGFNAGGNINLQTHGDAGLLLTNSTLTASNTAASGISGITISSSSDNIGGVITIQASTLTAHDDVDIGESGSGGGSFGGTTSIQSSVLASSSGFVNVRGGSVSIGGNSFLSGDAGMTIATSNGNLGFGALAIGPATFISGNGSVDLSGGNIAVGNSLLSGSFGVSANAGLSNGMVSLQASNLTSTNSGVILSGNNISIGGNSILSTDGEINLNGNTFGGGTMNIQSSTLNVANSDLELISGGIITIGNSTLSASDEVCIDGATFGIFGTANILSSNLTSTNDEVFVASGNVSIIGSTLSGSTGVVLEGDNSLGVVSVQSSNLTISNTGNNGISITSGGNVSVANVTATSTGGYVNIGGGQVVTVVNSVLVTPIVNISAPNVSGASLTMNNVSMNQATSVSLAARTISLSNINFPGGSAVSLSSANGLLAPNPNTNASPQVNYVNFITNVNYNHQPAQNFVPTSQGGSGGPTSPIQLHALP